MTVTDGFLIDFRCRFLRKPVQVDLVSNISWTGILEQADGGGLWLTEEGRSTWLPWRQIEAVICPPLPEAEE